MTQAETITMLNTHKLEVATMSASVAFQVTQFFLEALGLFSLVRDQFCYYAKVQSQSNKNVKRQPKDSKDNKLRRPFIPNYE